MDYLLGIDIGTSSVKAAVVEAKTARVVASATREYPVQQPQPGYAEQFPDDWWDATVFTVQEAIQEAQVNGEAIRAIGLSGQMHGTVSLDAGNRPTQPAIIWADTRSKTQVERLMAQTPIAEMAQYAPGRPTTGFMSSTLMWLAQHEPTILNETQTVMLPKDYVRFKLIGKVATDVSDAAATWLLDVKTGAWSDWLIEQCGVERRYLPPVLESTAVAGGLTDEVAELLGLPAGMPVVTGCADQPAQALGCGVYEPGVALVTIGTGGQVFMPLGTPEIDPQLRYYTFNHALPGRWYAAAAILAAGLALRWLRDTLGLKERPDAYAHLSKLAADVPPGADGLLFLPYLAGERTPHFDPDASGVFLGLRLHHHAGHLARAVMEGVTFALADCLALMPETPTQVIASGGATASPAWLQIQADVFNRPIHVVGGEHHACVGAALLAGVGSGVYTSVADACSRLPPAREVAVPSTQTVAFYAQCRAHYSELYGRLHQDMLRLKTVEL